MIKSKTGLLEKVSFKMLECYICGRSEKVDSNVETVMCHVCLSNRIPLTEINIPKPSSGKPRGWHLSKVFVDKKGNVYHKGVEQKELKGTLDPTKEKPKATPAERKVLRLKLKKKKEAKMVIRHNKKMLQRKIDDAIADGNKVKARKLRKKMREKEY